MPLNKLKAAMLCASDRFARELRRARPVTLLVHPLHSLLSPRLLTTRQCSDKWDSTIPALMNTDLSSGSLEDEMMWFNVRNERMDELADDEEAASNEEQWRIRWLRRMEQRE